MPLIHALGRSKFSDKGPVPQVLNLGTHLASMLLCLKDAQELRAPESDASEVVFCVLAGSGRIVEGESVHSVTAGDIVHFAPGERKALCAGDGELTVLGVRSLRGHS